MAERDDEWAYKIPFALQWMWPVPLSIGIWLAPESPWWLVRKGRIEDAKKSLFRLTNRDTGIDFNADETISMMIHTNEMEKEAQAGTTYLDLFRGTSIRRTETVCVTWVIQTLCGSTFMGFSTLFFQSAGMDVSNSFTMSLVQYGLGALGTLTSWFLMAWFGRRTLTSPVSSSWLFSFSASAALLSPVATMPPHNGPSARCFSSTPTPTTAL